MKKHELLVPAGNMECLYQAVLNGCDAVYLAGKNFGARKYANNFTNAELIEAIKYCHLYGVKIYVTMNTLVKDNEVDAFIDQARFLHKNGVDAVIVQDFGMICLLREKFPNLEIHASTQVNNRCFEICKLYHDMGIKRVVFAREMSIDEIKNINVDIEKEVFIHGALCVSYSGQCLMSSMLGGRSGNRGECAGCCRMRYSLIHEDKTLKSDKYLLSMKELNTSSRINDLISSDIYSFKIEGRMKSPLYVGFITRFYRNLIDHEELDLDMEIKKLKTIFNRDFTLGHLFGENDSNLINSSSPNHIGLTVGSANVVGKKIRIFLNDGETLNQFDAIRFLNNKEGMVVNYLYNEKMKLCNSAKGVCYVDNKISLNNEDVVAITHSSLVEEEMNNQQNTKKINIEFNVYAKRNKKLKICVSDGVNNFVEYGDLIVDAINAPTNKETVLKHISKLGGTPFTIKNINLDMDDNVFIQIKMINEIRRKLVNKIMDARKNNKVGFTENDFKFEAIDLKSKKSMSCSVFTEEQLIACLELNVDYIYVRNKSLFEKYRDNENVYFFFDNDFKKYNKNKSKLVVSDIFPFKGNDIMGNYLLNVTNIYTVYFLSKLGLKTIPLSVELNIDELKEMVERYNNIIGECDFQILAYGRIENMIIKGNILDIIKDDYTYSLLDTKKRRFPVYFDGVNTHVLNYEIRNIIDNLNISYRFDFYDESSFKIKEILKKYSS